MEVRRCRAVNILLINYEYPPIGGGAGNATMFIARALQRLGHRPTVLTSAYREQTGVQHDNGVTVHRLNVRRRETNRASASEMFSFTRAALREAPAIATRSDTEAVIVFFTLPCGPVALRLHRLRGLPYIVSLRGGDVPGLVPEIAWQHWLLTPLRRSVLRSARAIVANDPGLADLSTEADPFPVEVITNGVDCEFYRPRPQPKASGAPTEVLFVGRFHRQKNLPFFLEQLAQLNATSPNGWRLSLVGDGEERLALEQCVRRLNLGSITIWLGWQKDKARLLELYQQSDVVVNPSHYEGMPNVVLEAMACGLPVVASDVPGNNSLVRPGETGFLFALNDGNALRHALQQIRARPELARTLGENARNRVQKEFSWTHVAHCYLELFRSGI
jgi:glycosyltransferase involved in cell wall biosynthesis